MTNIEFLKLSFWTRNNYPIYSIIQTSGFRNRIEPGDVVMANKGFLIEEELILQGARLAIIPVKSPVFPRETPVF